MIGYSLKSALGDMVSKPIVLLPMFIVSLATFLLTFFTSWAIEKPISDFYLYFGALQNVDLFSLLLTNYPLEVVALVLSGIIVMVITVIALLSLARFADRGRFVEAVNDSIAEWKKSLALVVVFGLIGIVFFAALILAAMAATINDILGWLALIVWLIILFIVLVKLVFFFPALVNDDPKKALKLSWEFTNDKFWSTVLFMIILLAVFFVVNLIFNELSSLTENVFVDILMIISDTITMTFFGLAVSHYFYSE